MGDAKTVTLTAPNGMQVNVAAEKAERLVVNGYVPVEDEKKAPAKKPAARKSS